MATFISLVFVALFVLGVAVQVLTFRKERKVRPRRIIFGQAAAFLSMVIFSVITLRPPGPSAWVFLLGLGFTVGLFYGRLVKLRTGVDGVKMSYTLPWLIAWGALMTLTQLTAIFAQSVPVLIYGLAILNLGINIGLNTRVVVGSRAVAGATVFTLVLALVVALGVGLPGSAVAESVTSEEINGDGTGYLSWEANSAGDAPAEVRGVIQVADGVLGGSGTTTMYFPGQEESAPISGYFERMTGGWQPGGVASVNYSFDRTVPAQWDPQDTIDPMQLGFTVGVNWYESASGAEEMLGQALDVNPQFYSTYEVSVGDRAYVRSAAAGGGAAGTTSQVLVIKDNAYIEFAVQAGWYDAGNKYNIAGADIVDSIVGAAGSMNLQSVLDQRFGPLDGGAAPPIDGGTSGGSSSGGDSSGGTSGGGSTNGTASGDDGDKKPLSPVQSTSAVVFSSIILAGGSLLQLLDDKGLIDGSGGKSGGGPDPLKGVPKSEDGDLVFIQMPWDEGGAAWVKADDARHALDMQARGYSWDSRWGWVSSGEAERKQALADHGRQAWLEQDPEIARIQARIRAARAGQQHHRDMAANHQRAIDIIDKQSELEAQAKADMDAAAWADYAYYAVSGVGMIADMAIGTIATAATATFGPLGQGIRLGYNFAKGIGTAAGENLVAARGPDGKPRPVGFHWRDMKRGLTYGGINAVFDFGMEAGVKKLTGAPQIWQVKGFKPPATPPHLMNSRAMMQEAVGHVDDIVAKGGMNAAMSSVDEGKVLTLFRNGGMGNLAELEAAGQITRGQAQVMTGVLSKHMDDAIVGGTQDAVEGWAKEMPGVRLQRAVMGDSGSSATAGRVRSVLTDFDRTAVAVFQPDDVANYATKRGLTPAQAYAELNERFAAMQQKAVGQRLPGGLSLDDVDYKAYSGFGEAAGQADAYPVGFTRLRQGVQGDAIIVRPGGRVVRTSGQAILDESDLMRHAVSDKVPFAQPSFPVNEFGGVANQQMQALVKYSDPKSTAKALDRLLFMAERGEIVSTGLKPDAAISQISRAIVREPQKVESILRAAGLTPETWAQMSKAEGSRISEHIMNVVSN